MYIDTIQIHHTYTREREDISIHSSKKTNERWQHNHTPPQEYVDNNRKAQSTKSIYTDIDNTGVVRRMTIVKRGDVCAAYCIGLVDTVKNVLKVSVNDRKERERETSV